MTRRGSSPLPVLRRETHGPLLSPPLLQTNPAGNNPAVGPPHGAGIAELACEIGADPGNLHADVQRLVQAGVLADRRVGRTRLLRADASSPLVRPLTDLPLVAYGPKPLLEIALSGEPGIESALIVGSWAARYHGEPGPPPGDVDLVVIGEPDRDAVIEKVAKAS